MEKTEQKNKPAPLDYHIGDLFKKREKRRSVIGYITDVKRIKKHESQNKRDRSFSPEALIVYRIIWMTDISYESFITQHNINKYIVRRSKYHRWIYFPVIKNEK